MSSALHLARFAERIEQYRYDPVGFCRDILEFEPHDGQQRWLRGSTSKENALVTGNRYGKSFVGAAKRIWRCAFRKGWDGDIYARATRNRQRYQSINISLTADQAKIVWYKAEMMLKGAKASWLVKDVKLTPFPTIIFVNDAVFEARSTAGDGRHLLGHDYDDANWDEAAFEKKFEIIRDNVIRMRLVDRRGRLDYTSTGNGRNTFGMYFLSGLPGPKKNPDLYSQTGPSYENPNIPHDWLDSNAKHMSDRMRRQNILGEIVDAGGGYFDIADLEAAIDSSLTDGLVVHTLDDQENVRLAEVYVGRDIEAAEVGVPWHNKFHSHRYIHFWDLADKKDWVVGWTLDTSGDQLVAVEFERFHKEGWSYNYGRIRDRHRRYQLGDVSSGANAQSKTYLDLTGIGDVVADELKDIRAEGINFAGGRKDEILTDLQSALSLRRLRMPMIPVAYDECKFYERDDESLVQDCVMALAGAVHFGKRKRFHYDGENV